MLTEALQGRTVGSQSLPPLGRNHQIGPEDVEEWLVGGWPPSRLLQELLPCFGELADLELKQLARLRALLAIAAGHMIQVPIVSRF